MFVCFSLINMCPGLQKLKVRRLPWALGAKLIYLRDINVSMDANTEKNAC